jgi:secreted trypsin-like serine protease
MKFLLLLCLALPALGKGVDQRIIGGSGATIGNNPHQLSLRVNGVHTCGASLISSTRAVTAGQCAGQPIGVYSLLGGTADRTVTNCATCVLTDLTSIALHPSYSEDPNIGYRNDIAVLGFDPVAFNSNLNSITLATDDGGDLTGSECVATGWGLSEIDGDFEEILQQGDFTFLSNTDCEGTWGQGQIGNGHLCGYGAGQTATCNGDEGGPLVCGDELAGVASWHDEDCSVSWRSVFTRIPEYYDWINEQL